MGQQGGLAARAKLEVERARARYGVVDIGVRTFRRFSEDDGGVLAAALTYYTFFSIFPLLIFAAAFIGYLTFLKEELRTKLLETGIESVPLLSQVLTEDSIGAMRDRRGALVLVGFLLALYSGSGGIAALGHALNRINRVSQEGNLVSKRLASLRWLALLGLAGVLTVALGAGIQWLVAASGASPPMKVLGGVAGIAVSLALNIAIFMTAFKFLTTAPKGWREVLPGAIVGAVAFELLKHFGARYVAAGAEGRNATFGAFATAAALLVASYLLAQITLLAAELNAVLAERRTTRESSTR
ncbi:MAG TPA: YihY/virulence factor BrkB family protein [Actinomycetota bacterium]|nr:YihY/virulence factor BrkB family protein [Actinomycetota bacterium]